MANGYRDDAFAIGNNSLRKGQSDFAVGVEYITEQFTA